MKNIILFIGVISFALCFDMNAQTQVDWVTINEAQEKNRESPKNLIVDFTASWCGWCKKMDATTFSNQKVADILNSDFYAVKMDFESPDTFMFDGNQYTAKSFAKKVGIEGLPTMVIISPDYRSFDKLAGYKKSKDFLKSIKSF